MTKLKYILPFLFVVSTAWAGKLQNSDFATPVQITGAGGTIAQLLNDTNIFLSASGQQLSTAFSSGFIANSSLPFTWAQQATPANPAAGFDKLYFKADDKLYGLSSAGIEVLIGPGAGGGSVTNVSVVNANGFDGTVANPATTPAITIKTTVVGITKGNGTALSAAVSGTDYQFPISNFTCGANTFVDQWTAPNTFTCVQPSFANLAGSISAAQMLALPTNDLYIGNGANQPVATAVSGDLSNVAGAFTVTTVGTSSAANVHLAELAANAATAVPTASTISKWDASSNMSANAFLTSSFVDYTQIATPAAPAALHNRCYTKADNKFYCESSAAVETLIGPGAGATSPLTTKGDIWGYSAVDARIPACPDGQSLQYDATQALGVKCVISAITSFVPTNIQSFTTNGTWTVPAGVYRVAALVVGGGGGASGGDGTAREAGGGGAGGSVVFNDNISVTPGTVIKIRVGPGGQGTDGGGNAGGCASPGIPSAFGNYYAQGGQEGLGFNCGTFGIARGNEGGDARQSASIVNQSQYNSSYNAASGLILSSAGYFNNGASYGDGTYGFGGGGGGAGGNGTPAIVASNAGGGGAGFTTVANGTIAAACYGGGGGGGSANVGFPGGTATCGGGAGGVSAAGTTATANTGGGGGGGASEPVGGTPFGGAAGGSGLVNVYWSSAVAGGWNGLPTVFGTTGAPQVVAAAVAIIPNTDPLQYFFLTSTGGAVVVTANPQIAPGFNVGQQIILQGTDDINFLTYNDGNGLALNGAFNLNNKETIRLVWDGSVWNEEGSRK